MKHTESEFLAEIFTAPKGEAGPHLSNEQLDACSSGTLADAEREPVERHLDHCAECAEILLRLLEADAAPDEPIPLPIYVPSFAAIRARHELAERGRPARRAGIAGQALEEGSPFSRLSPAGETPALRLPASDEFLALAASEKTKLPEVIRIDGLLPGFSGEATGDGCAPSMASTLWLSLTAPESPRPDAVPAGGVLAVWPTGQTMPTPFAYRTGRWRARISLPLQWPEVVELLVAARIRLEPLPARI